MPVASAQVKSALLLAALTAEGTTHVTEPAPTRDHTERMLARFGVQLKRRNGRLSLDGRQILTGTSIEVPADFSSAAFFLVAGVLAAREGLLLRRVGVNPTRVGLLKMLQLMGADIRVHPLPGTDEPIADIEVRAGVLRGIEVPLELVPLAIDELPVFFIAAACAQGETLVRGAEELRVKESDRLAAMAQGLGVLGIEHELRPDGIRIRGGKGFTGGRIDSHGDHRIAMAFAIAGTRASAPIEIADVANVRTSFPGFVGAARGIGLSISERSSEP
jgi:3-phosphoshikimate 1-carboxyvinyltransferase